MAMFHRGPWWVGLLSLVLLAAMLVRGDEGDGDQAAAAAVDSVTVGAPYFTNEFAVLIRGGAEVARDVAEQHGYQLRSQIGSLPDYYLLKHDDTPSRSRREADQVHTQKLVEDQRVLWFQQQEAKERTKRDAMPMPVFDDPLYQSEWYLNGDEDSRTTTGTDMRVRPVWAQGITGKGVVVSVVDDGLEKNHEDIKENYDPKASWNFNEDRADPTPPKERYFSNGHGTRCAGEVSMVANNSKCGVGIAYEANIGGIRMLDGFVTDAVEGAALSYNLDLIDIYSASWGPRDDGTTTSKPGPLAQKALEDGAGRGRGGKGALYAWASGNGGSQDNCNCDAYSSSIYTIATSSVSDTGEKTFYGEACPSILTAAYSSGDEDQQGVVSASLGNGCTIKHGGTSAAAPMTAGVLALLLQANPELTWRDVQHIIVQTSRVRPLRAAGVHWRENGAGHPFSDHFGFGLLDAHAMVSLADPASWVTVPDKTVCTIRSGPSFAPRKISYGHPLVMHIQLDGCRGTSDEVKYLEHVVLQVTTEYTARGALNIHLTSPAGTETKLLSERKEDHTAEGLTDFPLMSVQLWGENAQTGKGVWKLHVFDSRPNGGNKGFLREWKLQLHGTVELPNYMRTKGDGQAA